MKKFWAVVRKERILAALIGGVPFMAVFATQFNWQVGPAVFASAALLALASGFAGGFLGLLFGIPRSRTRPEVPPAPPLAPAQGVAAPVQPAATTVADTSGYTPNTNLEEISDWLTKILVGVGLTQIGTIPEGVRKFLDFIQPSLGGQTSARVLALSIVTAYGVGGFLWGYVWARTALLRVFANAEHLQDEVAEVKKEQSRQFQLIQPALGAVAAGFGLANTLITRGSALKQDRTALAGQVEQTVEQVRRNADFARKSQTELADVELDLTPPAWDHPAAKAWLADSRTKIDELVARAAQLETKPESYTVPQLQALLDEAKALNDDYLRRVRG
jgi:hypothetical protein